MTQLTKAKFWLALLRHSHVFGLGYAEGDGCIGRTYDDNIESLRSIAYDLGRDAKRKELHLDEEV